MNYNVPLSVKLNDGHFMPTLGLGTSAPTKVAKSKVEEAIQIAVDVGYRHIDSAIRKKIANGTVRREDIFCTSKVLTFSRPELVQTCLERSLKKLQLSYVDLYLIHCPMSFKPGEEIFPRDTHGKIIFDTMDLCSTWEMSEKCKDVGLAKSIGVSNFNRRQLEKILNKPGLKYKPVCNQVSTTNLKLLEFCKSKDIVLSAYAALGSDPEEQNSPVILEDPVLNVVAEKHGRTPAQVALCYQLQRGVVVLVKSFREKRIKENFQAFDFHLTPEDMKTLGGLNRNMRYFEVAEFANHPEYPFLDEY
uniref:NADP-dependent oxidoreductase domain-containing protein n=1 Tax=Prolemur simus TaxID=1328070 RepID=A0A8C8ZBG7_PROSS